MYILVNRDSIVVDVTNAIKYTTISELQPHKIVECTPSEAVSVMGDTGINYPLQDHDISNNPNAVTVIPGMHVPKEFRPFEYKYLKIHNCLIPLYFSAEERRENAYRSIPCIEIDGEMKTINEANEFCKYYMAENKFSMLEDIRKQIEFAKKELRYKYKE